ncbi:MAG: putative Ig domain-containing protein [Acidimicrobiales bacterium]
MPKSRRRTNPKPPRARALFAFLVGASIAVPVVAIATASASSGSTQDKIVFVQTDNQQNIAPYVEYEGANGTNLKQSLSVSSGNCESRKLSNPSSSVLPLSAAYYPNGYSSTSSEESASVGSEVTGGAAETGVCFNSRTSTGETIVPGEGLIFSVGQSNSLTEGRVFSEATIPLKSNTDSSASGALVLRRLNASGVEQTVDTVPFTIPRGGESPGDTNDCPVVSTGAVPPGDQFDQVEIQLDSPSKGSVSVVGPSCDGDNDNDDQADPTFYFDSAPAITSNPSATFVAGTAGTFTVKTTGYPTPTLSNTAFAANGSQLACTPSTLPSGVTFTNNGDGTATIAGTPASITTAGGIYTYMLCINASNAAGTATQAFSLTVDQAAGIASANNTTFTAGSPGTFTVTTTGYPDPSLSDASTAGTCTTSLPSGVTFTNNGDGTATIAGTPAAITTPGGTYAYNVCIAASNTFGGMTYSAAQTFTLTVDQAPAITSAAAATFTSGSSALMTEGVDGSFKVTTTGNPAPGITDAAFPSGSPTCTPSSPPLPSGVNLVDNGDGTATISGTPGQDSDGTYTLCLNANNGIGTPATQTFTLTVDQDLAITSADSTTFSDGTSGSFTVKTTGFPTPALSDTCTSSLPKGVGFSDDGDGTATISGTPASTDGGSYTVCVSAANGVTAPATQTLTLIVDQSPTITSADNVIVPVGEAFSFTVTTSGYPAPSLNDAGFSGCSTNAPSDVNFANNGDGTATISGTPASTDGGSYNVCITATNSTGSATQDFNLVITSSSNPLMATPNSGSDVTASLQVDSGSKSFSDFTTSTSSSDYPCVPGQQACVTFDTQGTTTYTATVDIDWGNLDYCVPYSSISPPTCGPSTVTFESGSPPAETTATVVPCGGTMSNPTLPPDVSWCSVYSTYSYPVVGGTQYTNIVEQIYGTGDLTFNHDG